MEAKVRVLRVAKVDRRACVACGACVDVCRPGAIKVVGGVYARADQAKCVGCGLCAKVCPASAIALTEVAR
ncbi:MAG: 4Fe-4S binding protein [Clostridiales bacterium]|nr:4Fe-4S binding protein [Clostridiales bacterium]